MADVRTLRRLEQRLLELAYTTDVRITAGALAYLAPCSLDDAAAVLDDLAGRDRLRMTVEDDGTIVYDLPGRQRIATAAAAAAPPPPPTQTALVRHAGVLPAHTRRSPRAPSPLVAAALSILVPGAGHLYARHVVAAIAWFFVVTAAYALIIPGLVLHAINIGAAAITAARETAA